MIYPDASEAELDQLKTLKLNEISTKMQTAHDLLHYVQEKHKSILSLEKSVIEAQHLFIDLRILLEKQAESIERIQNNVQTTKEYIKQG